MIDRAEIEAMSGELDVHTSHVQRDYVQGWILAEIFRSSDLAQLALKGGACFRKAYFESARYSPDLDLSTSQSLPEEQIKATLDGVCNSVQERTGIEFDVARTLVRRKTTADTDKTLTEARVYFRDFYGEASELVLALRLDVAQFDRIHLPIQDRALIHPYSDAAQCEVEIRCLKLEELLALKMRCLLQRRHIADLYDLAFSVLLGQETDIDRAQLLATFLRLTVFRPSPRVAKGLFIDLPLQGLKRFWGKYIACPSQSRFPFENANQALRDLVESLIPGEAVRERSATFFPSTLRNPIMAAGESHTLLRLTYAGATRLVEPYSLTFKVRADGVGREYFYAFDLTGGRSTGPGIKCFLPGRVQSIEPTEEDFEPRTEIQLRKAGGAETAKRFSQEARGSPGSWAKRLEYRYRVMCRVCGKTFKRKTMSLVLRPHKDRSGSRCPGRAGFRV